MAPPRNNSNSLMDDCIGVINENKKLTGEAFIPINTISDFTTTERTRDVLKKLKRTLSVLNELKYKNWKHIQNRIHDPKRSAKLIFLILATTGKLECLYEFLSGDFSDHHLPIDLEFDKGKDTKWTVTTAKDLTKTEMLFRHPHKIHYNDLDTFRNNQWAFLSPVFDGDSKFELKLSQQVPLPLIEKGNPIYRGISTVSKVKIHGSHLPGMGLTSLAMKTIDFGSDKQSYFFNKEQKNVKNFQDMNHDRIVKALCSCIRRKIHGTYEQDETVIFFPWAEGGDLRNFWMNQPSSDWSVSWMLTEMTGLCSALSYMSERNWRHSDLKPANILCFPQYPHNITLKITDFGVSKFHVLATNKRLDPTTAQTTTQRYCPPEFDDLLKENNPQLSRSFDIWSLGCIFLEFLMWMNLGRGHYVEYENEMTFSNGRFWNPAQRTLDQRVQSQIKNLKLSIQGTDSERDSDNDAIKKILELVQENMLLVESHARDKASEVERKVKDISDSHCEYCSTPNTSDFSLDLKDAQNLILNSSGSSNSVTNLVHPEQSFSPKELNTTAVPPSHTAAQSYVSRAELQQRQIAKLKDRWTVSADNEFSQKYFSKSTAVPRKENCQLCYVCSTLRIWENNTTISGTIRDFINRSPTCDLCHLLYVVSKDLGLGNDEELQYVRNGPIFSTAEGQPVLSLFTEPGNRFPGLEFAQVGYPTLSAPDSAERYRLFRQWLCECDSEHNHGLDVTTDEESLQMPTRLIYLGESGERLEETKDYRFQKYIALSHCWGGGPSLCTLGSNIKAFRHEIPHDLLPLNFQEAIKVARALKISYLWIDCLCIIQDDVDDWKREASHMGQVFSNAYCTIAATSAAASDNGFISPKIDTGLSVALKTPGNGLIYVAEFREDFHKDVELATLNTRGWVMQERALSRRTLHFSKTQVYWECGNGVYCERMFKLSNPRSALFADSDFPRSILSFYKGGRITLFQDLYQKYSRLNFTRITDRPIAVLGLQKRLATVLQTRGEFGIFEQYLARSLLWCRPDNSFLIHIPFIDSDFAPSWSWMAYEGPITYANVPFDQVEWNDECILPRTSEMNSKRQRPTLKALVRDLKIGKIDISKRARLDEQSQVEISSLRGVVLGKDKDQDLQDQLHYVLLVRLSEDHLEGRKVYIRAGVAWLLHSHIASSAEEIVIY